MESNYNQNYTREQIEEVLHKIKNCVANGHFTISLNEHRQENVDFIHAYNIRHAKQIYIIQQLRCEDFCYTLQNAHRGFEHEVLYVFAPQINLHNADGYEESVDMYIKFNLIARGNSDFTIVISFHRLNRPTRYLFR